MGEMVITLAVFIGYIILVLTGHEQTTKPFEIAIPFVLGYWFNNVAKAKVYNNQGGASNGDPATNK